MKEPIPELNQDIDAGWDEIAPTTSPVSISARPIDSQPPEVDELEAGWDIDQPSGESQTEKSTPIRHARAEVRDRNAPFASSQVSLTKKARKELERQNKIHEAKRKAEAKAERKKRKRAEIAPTDTAGRSASTAEISAREQGADTAKTGSREQESVKRNSRPKKKARSRLGSSHQSRDVRFESGESRGAERPHRSPAGAVVREPSPEVQSAPVRSRTKTVLVLILVSATLLFAIARWFR